jgi:hypothetical protein
MKVAIVITSIALLAGATWWTMASNRQPLANDQQVKTADLAASETAADAEKLVCITPHRIPVEFQRMTLCIAPAPDIGPHDVPEILVYANPIALDYRRMHPDNFDYPIGSTFVKHKFASRGQEVPDAATMMIRKANRGDISDWEFTSHSLPDQKLLGPANELSCIECHQGFGDRGFISWETEGALRRHLHLQ